MFAGNLHQARFLISPPQVNIPHLSVMKSTDSHTLLLAHQEVHSLFSFAAEQIINVPHHPTPRRLHLIPLQSAILLLQSIISTLQSVIFLLQSSIFTLLRSLSQPLNTLSLHQAHILRSIISRAKPTNITIRKHLIQPILIHRTGHIPLHHLSIFTPHLYHIIQLKPTRRCTLRSCRGHCLSLNR